MTLLGPILDQLGISQYRDRFFEEGFETWETVLDITEADLDALNVKRGHRRKLQREIASSRGLTRDQTLHAPAHTATAEDTGRDNDDEATVVEEKKSGAKPVGNYGKRKYRRHPKPDENAPERSPSAYVIFSNHVREELRGQNLSFTDIAKKVGEKWQMCYAEEKEPYELQAAAAKEKYHAEMAEYKKTENYRKYAQYLAEFKAKNSTMDTAEGKRPRLEQNRSTASSVSTSEGSARQTSPAPQKPAPSHGHGRVESEGSFPGHLAMAGYASVPRPGASGEGPKTLPGLAPGPGGMAGVAPPGAGSHRRSSSPHQPLARRMDNVRGGYHPINNRTPLPEEDDRDGGEGSTNVHQLPRIMPVDARSRRSSQTNLPPLSADALSYPDRPSSQTVNPLAGRSPESHHGGDDTPRSSMSSGSGMVIGSNNASGSMFPLRMHGDSGSFQRNYAGGLPIPLKMPHSPTSGKSGPQPMHPPLSSGGAAAHSNYHSTFSPLAATSTLSIASSSGTFQ
ncbi:MAG: hypothetical protein M1837_006840 [Sclerophora amabilis]|nr:MAG: hypothetical protein M1837_006840 [Sclerophora amabilis]